MKLLLFSQAPFIGEAKVAYERLPLVLMERGHKVTAVVSQQNDDYSGLRISGPVHVIERDPGLIGNCVVIDFGVLPALF